MWSGSVITVMKKATVGFVFLLLSFLLRAQTQQQLMLRDLGKTLLDTKVPDSTKYKNAERFLNGFEAEVLASGPEWVNQSVLPFVSRLSSDDKTLEVFTWNLKRAEDSFKSYGFAWVSDKDKEPRIIRFEDKSESVKNPETKNLGAKSWIGCVYYSLKDISRGKKRMYLLLGYGGSNPQVRRKVAEIITFNSMGDIQFGAPIFEKENRKFNRVVLEFNAKATVAMKFDEEQKTLFFDFLVPIDNKYIGNPAFYGPNGSYDAFQLKGQRLVFVKDADARNKTEEWGNRNKKVEKKLPPR